MAKPLMFLPPALFAALAGMFVWGMNREDPSQLPTALAGKPAPAVQLGSLEGAPLFTQADLADGQMKLVNFWASWCAPCRVEHPNLEALARDGVTVLGVNYKDDPEKAAGFLAELGNPYAKIGTDREGRMALDWGVYGVPETFVVDGEGKIVLRFAGPITEKVIEEQLSPYLGGEGE